ncbi:MAG: DEAD/DEAH box helicase [Pirellulaceae bacterium]|nr:DEAD/DEAH box helicase [Pirellulaceae bacterium]
MAKPTTVSRSKASLSQPSKRRDIRNRLGYLTCRQAERWLGQDGATKLRQGRQLRIDPTVNISIVGDTLCCTVPDGSIEGGIARVTIVEKSNRTDGVQFNCDACGTTCEHIAATLSEVLESKLVLGLSEEPDPKEPIENLTERELVARALADRKARAAAERMVVTPKDARTPWTDYSVTSKESGRSYRVSLRGIDVGQSYCSCPDFRTNQLGTCKHVLRVQETIEKKFSQQTLAKPYRRKNLSLRMHYGDINDPTIGLRWNLPSEPNEEVRSLLGKLRDQSTTDVATTMKLLRSLERSGQEVNVYPDAETFIEYGLIQQSLAEKAAEIRKNPKKHPLRKELLKVELLPYQLDGIAFAVGNGRAILADDMGLGKTIQGIGTAEMLGQLANVQNVLVVCPASLKSQWAAEIARFSDRTAKIVLGSAAERATQYKDASFFKIANYEQIVRDEAIVQEIHWDLIILDEGQRIKNWESKTSQTFGMLKSTYALVLSGTPLENRLEELYTVAKFIDSQRMGPAYRFLHRHRMVNDVGRVEGYKNLDSLRELMKPFLLRRTRAGVMQELPERTTEFVRVRPTEEQKTLSDEHVRKATMIAAKAYLTEMDLLRLQKHLLCARMAADSTFLVDKEPPGFSSKLEVLDELLEELSDEPTRKIILFSEWTNMLNLIEPLLTRHGIQFVRLEGKVPQKKRQELVHKFQTDPECRAIIMTNAGSTGLNLQAANTVINVDLPWNPAVLEQRIARAHRMGQKRPVHVYILITEETIEERLLGTLAAKSELASAALDFDNDLTEVSMTTGIDELKRRLEKILGEKPVAEIDESMRRDVETSIEATKERRDKVAAAGGELLGAALNLVSQLVSQGQPPAAAVVSEISDRLASCVERDDQGRPQLKFTLPNEDALRSLAQTLAQLLVQPNN